MMSRWKRIRHRIEMAGVSLLKWLVGIVPMGTLRTMGSGLGWTAFHLIKVRRKVLIENLVASFDGEFTRKQIEGIGSRSFRNFGKSLVEFASFEKLSAGKLIDMVEYQGLENLDEALKHGRGILFITGHFDNWELLGAGMAQNGYPVHFLVGEQSNKMVDGLMNRLRQAQGIKIITRSLALRKVLKVLSDNQIIALLADQDAGRNGIFVDFFGRPASTFKGPATFAVKQGCPIVCGVIIRRPGRQRHLGIIEKPIWPPSGIDKKEAVRLLTQNYTERLEHYIRLYPDHYFWAHKRWKTKPPAS